MLDVLFLDIKGGGQGKTETFSLTRRIPNKPLVTSEHLSVFVHKIALGEFQPRITLDKVSVGLVLDKANILAVMLLALTKPLCSARALTSSFDSNSPRGKRVRASCS